MSLLGKILHHYPSYWPAQAWPSSKSDQRLVSWLVSLQTTLLQEEELAVSDEPGPAAQIGPEGGSDVSHAQVAAVVPQEATLPDSRNVESLAEELQWAGLTGRCNKIADTCYSFWVGGSLSILNRIYLLDQHALRRYLIEKTQHRIGGFGKLPGDPPGKSWRSQLLDQPPSTSEAQALKWIHTDILHSCLGLAGLAGMGEPGLRPFDPALCVSQEVRQRLHGSPWRHSWVEFAIGHEGQKPSD
ncbi:MAG: hypothetical protein Q9201_003894 [Fulgogasparrea decipioides]